jgi:hypothetical protein
MVQKLQKTTLLSIFLLIQTKNDCDEAPKLVTNGKNAITKELKKEKGGEILPLFEGTFLGYFALNDEDTSD